MDGVHVALSLTCYPERAAESITLLFHPNIRSSRKQLSFLLANAVPALPFEELQTLPARPTGRSVTRFSEVAAFRGRGSGGWVGRGARRVGAWECGGHRRGSGLDSWPRSSLSCLKAILSFA